MEINEIEADPRANSDPAGAAPNDMTELELYDELVAFSLLSTEEQRFLTARPGPGSAPVARPVAETGPPDLRGPEESLFEPGGDLVSDYVSASGTPPIAEPDREADPFKLASPDAKAAAAPPPGPSFERAGVSEINNSQSRPANNTGDLRLSNTGPLGDIWSGVTVGSAAPESCPACGVEPRDEDLFCFECGEFLVRDSVTRLAAVCAECDSIIGNDDIFCPSCGSTVPAD